MSTSVNWIDRARYGNRKTHGEYQLGERLIARAENYA
jgi:hypothetical protein